MSFNKYERIPFGVHRINDMYISDTKTEISIADDSGRPVHTAWVHAVTLPYQHTFVSKIKALWWVLTGRAEAVVWPKLGDLERTIGFK